MAAWKLLADDDGFGSLDLTEAIGTLDLACYVALPLPWEREPTRVGGKVLGLRAGKHTAGFVSTLRDLSGRTGAHGTTPSMVHSSAPTAAADYVDALAELMRKTKSIAMMTESVTKETHFGDNSDGGKASKQKETPSRDNGLQKKVGGKKGMELDEVKRRSEQLKKKRLKEGVAGELEGLKERITQVVACHPNIVEVFRETDEDGDGTLGEEPPPPAPLLRRLLRAPVYQRMPLLCLPTACHRDLATQLFHIIGSMRI